VDQRTATPVDQGMAVLTVRGDIDLATAPALRDVVLPTLERGTGLCIDLSDVTFIDSSGVNVLLDSVRRLTPEKRRLAVACREGGPVHRILALLGLLDTLTVHRSRVSAVLGGDDLIRPQL
jgi:anti-anti-sigma factor